MANKCNCKYSNGHIVTCENGYQYDDGNTLIDIIDGKMCITLNKGDCEAEGYEEISISYCPFCGREVIK